MFGDTIYLKERPTFCFEIPRVKVNPNEKWIKHVHCEGARFHVLSWRLSAVTGHASTRCSEPDCIINKPKDTQNE